ncbi:TPA: DUF262 domain-containing protein [Clostridium botulinum]|uniref:DUF262 domain-containing protein n=1 Tax=Clostridium botulinum TaxID=1491 RepID=UPI003310F63E|nr:DUF262 domain-containing protein [Clostridium botulinum]HCL4449754.1 DUF262 domain-containing protein [Clostridium botulinum]HCL4452027.1 DUF262 domain-containing protein [Clostridium botulinum]HCL4454253.1 DUF262 domain-containing protein [Clostridium botulinum]HCL4455916.1 DUF262 domain-containing protein [Clostridium botulinum]
MDRKYRINPKNEDSSIRSLIEDIDKGYKLQEIKKELTEAEILKYTGSIIIAPDYQREYRFKLEDEVKLIESVLLGIPIPPIFLATDKYKGVRVKNVVDGQHRLRALHRFYNNSFSLEGLDLLEDMNGKKFEDLDISVKADYLDAKLSNITFSDFPGVEFEMEIFSRYNKGTKPLSPQEIRHAAYNSKINSYINDFAYDLFKEKSPRQLYDAYNASKDRIQKKKVQEGIFVILSILENGINIKYDKSLVYAEEYMRNKKELEKESEELAQKDFDNVVDIFNEFNKFIIRLQEKIEFPFSKEIYGVSSRNYKFQISIAMIIAGVFREKIFRTELLDKILVDDTERDKFLQILCKNLSNSFLEDVNYNASSTNSKKIKELIDNIQL